ncbi:MAG: response regulator transcription factor [Solirubrobacteraceae bacterium]|jgi:DNA-binding NarL/FixJ family response regulator
MASHIKPKVIVVDDHELFRGGLVGLLDERNVEVVAEVASAGDALAAVSEREPDVVLMDLSLPDMSGIEATRLLAIQAPSVRVVVLSVMADDQHVIDALQAGACGYVLKDTPIDQIVAAIDAALRGESLISPRIAGRLVRRLRQPAGSEPEAATPVLTDRELEVLELLARGVDNQKIAQTLFLSEHTIKNHVSSLLVKFDVDNRLQAAVRAVRARIV